MTTSNHDLCRNCGAELVSVFCPQCGQKKIESRLSLKAIGAEFLQSVFLLESKLTKTLGDLLRRPGTMVRSYVEGQRTKYVAPIQFFLFWMAIYLVALHFAGNTIMNYLDAGQNARLISGRTAFSYITQHANLFGFLQVPVMAWWFWLGMRKGGVLYAESLILGFYLIGVSVIFMSAMVILAQWNGKFMLLRGLVIIAYFPWAAMQFSRQKSAGAFFKFLFLSIGAYVSFIVIVACITLLALLTGAL